VKRVIANLAPPLFIVYYVYVIKNKYKNGNLYFGYTSDLKRRISEHGVAPRDLIYYEAYQDKGDARNREAQLKKYKSAWGQLKKRIYNSVNKKEGVTNFVTARSARKLANPR